MLDGNNRIGHVIVTRVKEKLFPYLIINMPKGI